MDCHTTVWQEQDQSQQRGCVVHDPAPGMHVCLWIDGRYVMLYAVFDAQDNGGFDGIAVGVE